MANVTTLAGALGKNDVQAVLTSIAGATDKAMCRIGMELCAVAGTAVGNSVILRRGLDGTTVSPHAAGETVVFGTGNEFGTPQPGAATVVPPLLTKGYSASGAIDPVPHVAILPGNAALAMTLAPPAPGIGGQPLTITAVGKAAHTLTATGGFGGGGATQDVLTLTAALGTVTLTALDGQWLINSIGNAAVA